MIEGRDIRELTRAIDNLSRTTQSLLRHLEKIKKEEMPTRAISSEGFFCSGCMLSNCVRDVVYSNECDCCKVNHDPQ